MRSKINSKMLNVTKLLCDVFGCGAYLSFTPVVAVGLANPSVTDLQRETSIMLQILDKLDLRTPVIVGSSDDYL